MASTKILLSAIDSLIAVDFAHTYAASFLTTKPKYDALLD
jgi:hypothetical protein